MPPLTCYVCEHFQPKQTAPHSQMLEAAHQLRKVYSAKDSASNSGLELIDKVIVHIQGVIEATAHLENVGGTRLLQLPALSNDRRNGNVQTPSQSP